MYGLIVGVHRSYHVAETISQLIILSMHTNKRSHKIHVFSRTLFHFRFLARCWFHICCKSVMLWILQLLSYTWTTGYLVPACFRTTSSWIFLAVLLGNNLGRSTFLTAIWHLGRSCWHLFDFKNVFRDDLIVPSYFSFIEFRTKSESVHRDFWVMYFPLTLSVKHIQQLHVYSIVNKT